MTRYVQILLAALALLTVLAPAGHSQPPEPTAKVQDGIWISSAEIAALPDTGPAWERLKKTADEPLGKPDLKNQDDDSNIRILARALVFARTGIEHYRLEALEGILAAVGTEQGGRTLALGRNLAALVISAELLSLPDAADARFRAWLIDIQNADLEGKTLRTTHEVRPNNWGTLAGASRVAVARYLKNDKELARCAQVFKGWLGDRNSYAGFVYKNSDWWQADQGRPVGINPAGAMRQGHLIDGVLPDDQRRSGPFAWPPPHENYVYSALQGVLTQAVILSRAGYDVWNWEDRAILRAFNWLNLAAGYPADGDDEWLPHLVNHAYGTDFTAPVPAKPGKIMGFSDWTHGPGTR